ncbi:MerR family transcriptional regulator [Fodinicola acaciae]|uniref:MerR family transcriptional regulator n=1 Tax=Fodinicola acaciae TaxID=2681555 RepID=UPI0013D3300D|nr:MerR family transcriptional regulator [Fodinicola acaciae]
MELVTIGEFARMARLSAKALRLYDELGLLPPARVDGLNGYRYYDVDQLERARLIAWLRRLDMPLARIRAVCDLPPAEAAMAVAAYWDEVAAETAVRERLATFLVDHLAGRGGPVGDTGLAIRYAAKSAAGIGRETNEDTAYAGAGLLAVADGVRGQAGELASAAAVDALKPLGKLRLRADDLLNALADAVDQADAAVRDVRGVTTLTAALWTDSQLALVHIGDTRAYVLRAGEIFQITHDHTHVQRLVDAGRLTAEEAASHPQRALLVRALTGDGSRADISLHPAAAGDRYLLCSDGLSGVVEISALRKALSAGQPPADTVDALIGLAYAAGAPDNVACVVADVIEP